MASVLNGNPFRLLDVLVVGGDAAVLGLVVLAIDDEGFGFDVGEAGDDVPGF